VVCIAAYKHGGVQEVPKAVSCHPSFVSSANIASPPVEPLTKLATQWQDGLKLLAWGTVIAQRLQRMNAFPLKPEDNILPWVVQFINRFQITYICTLWGL
jgi:hypothetical protein